MINRSCTAEGANQKRFEYYKEKIPIQHESRLSCDLELRRETMCIYETKNLEKFERKFKRFGKHVTQFLHP